VGGVYRNDFRVEFILRSQNPASVADRGFAQKQLNWGNLSLGECFCGQQTLIIPASFPYGLGILVWPVGRYDVLFDLLPECYDLAPASFRLVLADSGGHPKDLLDPLGTDPQPSLETPVPLPGQGLLVHHFSGYLRSSPSLTFRALATCHDTLYQPKVNETGVESQQNLA